MNKTGVYRKEEEGMEARAQIPQFAWKDCGDHKVCDK